LQYEVERLQVSRCADWGEECGEKLSPQRAQRYTGAHRANLNLHGDADLWLGVGEYFTDLDSGNACLIECSRESFAFGSADQEASGGLRVVEYCAEIFGDLLVVFDHAFGEGTIVVETSGDVSGVDAVQGALQDGDFAC